MFVMDMTIHWAFRNKQKICQVEEIVSAFKRPFQTSHRHLMGKCQSILGFLWYLHRSLRIK